jgi:hypothetical protein
MNKPFLLIAGYHYHPESGTSNWIACFETKHLAKCAITDLSAPEPNIRFANYVIDGVTYDWVEIVDLRTWTN